MNNVELSKKLAELAAIHDTLGSTFKARAYKIAAQNVLKVAPITTANSEDIEIAGVGKGIREKIVEFVASGRIAEIDQNRVEMAARTELEPLMGVGPVTAGKWIKAGITSVESLRTAVKSGKVTLNTMQALGLKYYDDLRERIPRQEVTEIVSKLGAIVISIDPAAIVTCAGSYRRGAESSGDIDIIVSNRGGFVPDLIKKLAAVLKNTAGFVANTAEGDERYTFLWRNCDQCKVRQVDILNIRYNQYFPSLVYFTGSWEFNEAMRGHAKSLGFRLNQHGLYNNGELVQLNSEEEIFAAIGLKYVLPADRKTADDVITV